MCKISGLNIIEVENKCLGENMEPNVKEGGFTWLQNPESQNPEVKKNVLGQFCYLSRILIMFYQTIAQTH